MSVTEVDCDNLLTRILCTPQSELRDSRGRYVGAIHGFIVSLGALIHKRRFRDFIICCWDSGVALHRRELYRNYKSHKNPIGDVGKIYLSDQNLISKEGDDAPDDFIEQYQICKRLLHSFFLPYMGCLSIQVPNCEADDIIAYVCGKLTDEEIVILSSDKDFIQLLSPNVSLYNGITRESTELEDVIQKYNLVSDRWKHHWCLARAMAGDPSDNIKGVGGIGLEGCIAYARQIVLNDPEAPLVEALSRLQRIPRGREEAYENLKKSADVIKRNYRLMDLLLPTRKQLPLINDIKAHIAQASLLEPDSERIQEELHDLQLIKAKLYAQYICESNEKFDAKIYHKRLVL
jgi:5'-3' exonuclease